MSYARKRLITLTCFFTLAAVFFLNEVSAAATHEYSWTLTAGGTGIDDMGHGVTTDKDGNIYYTGHYQGAVDLDPTAGSDIRQSITTDTFITKLNADGTYAWTRTTGGPTYFSRGAAIEVADNGNIYLTGNFSGTQDFNPSDPVDPDGDFHTAQGYRTSFVMKINPDGSYGWTRVVGGTFYIFGKTIAIDSNENIFLAGSFFGSADFDQAGAGDTRTSAGSEDIFLMKINPDGSYGWTQTMGSTGYDMGHAVAVDPSDNVYFTGHFGGSVDLDPTAATQVFTSNNNSADIFIIKYDATGTYQWTNTMGGAGWDGTYNTETDAVGNVYISGLFEGTSDLDPTSGVDSHTSTGPIDLYLTKLNANGTYAWSRTFGEPSGFYYVNRWNWGGSMSVDKDGNAYLARCFVDTMDFDPATADSKTSAGLTDIFLTRVNADGSYGWTKTMGGPGLDCANANTVDDNGNIYVTGNYTETVDFGQDGISDIHTSNGSDDIFLTRFGAIVTNNEPEYDYRYRDWCHKTGTSWYSWSSWFQCGDDEHDDD